MAGKSQVYIKSLKAGIEVILSGNSDIPPEAQNYLKEAEDFLGIGTLEKPAVSSCLRNIFERIYTKSQTQFFKMKPLDLENETFQPTAEPQGEFSSFEKDFKTKVKEFDGSLETLFFLCKKYLSFVPVNSNHPHINAFEFLKLRSAFAQCLHDFEQEKDKATTLPFLMVCIDISGIQNFIYNIASSKATKSLKGRSFYLQLLMDSLIQRTFQDTKKGNIGHVIYASGGKAYLLLPNLETVKDAIEKLEEKVEENIYEAHQERLYVLMDFVEFDTDQKNIADLWTTLGEKTAQKKFRKYQRLFSGEFGKFFEPKGEDGFDTTEIEEKKDGGKKVCAVTGDLIKNATPRKNSLTYRDEDKPHVWVTKEVKKQSELGKKLKDTTFYVTYHGKQTLSENAQNYAIEPVNLGVFSYIRDNDDFIKEYLDTGDFYSVRRSLVRKINDTNFLDTLKGRDASYGFTFYGGNQQALKWEGMEEVEKDYEDLVGITKEEDKGSGFHRLGILRMDVDGLGGLFADKMKENDLQNFPAYAMVSAHLENFFAGYLNMIRNQKKYKEWVNILYSGGDDVFAVGRWDLILDFAQDIQQAFLKFTGGKPTLSAGVAMIGGKFPISKGADMAGSAEGKAKKFGEDKNNDIPAKKNAICFFDEVVSWEEFGQIHRLKNYIMEWLDNPETKFSKSLVYKIFQFRDLRNKRLQDWKWLSVYQFARLENAKNPKSRKAFQFLKDVFGNHKDVFDLKVDWEKNCVNISIKSERAMDILCLASRWAELELRMKNNEK